MRSRQELKAATGQSIHTRRHGLVLKPRDGEAVPAGKPDDFVRRTIAMVRRHGTDHEVPDTADLRRHCTQFRLNDNEFACGAGGVDLPLFGHAVRGLGAARVGGDPRLEPQTQA